MSLNRICLSFSSLAWATALLYFYQSGRIDAYLADSLRIYSLIGGLLLAVVGLFNLLVKSAPSDHGHCGDCCSHSDHDHEHHHHDHVEHGHDHEHGNHEHHDHDHDEHHHHEEGGHEHGSELPAPLALLLMLVPLLFAIWYTVDDYSSSALIRKGLYADQAPQALLNSQKPPTFTLEQFKNSTPVSADGYYQVQLIDLFFASTDEELRAIFATVPVEVIGQVARQEGSAADELRVYRLFITCCNADAQPISARAKVEGADQWQDQQWVKLSGKVEFSLSEDGIPVPIFMADKIEAHQRPDDAWLNSGN